MTRSPILRKTEVDDIIDERKDAGGSAWDTKIHPKSQLNYFDLRYRVGEAVVKDGYTIKEASKHFGVSTGFVSDWSRVFRARELRNKGGKRSEYVKRDVFKSHSNRPHHVTHPIQDTIREDVIARRRKYGFEGAFRIKKAIGVSASPTTINKVLRFEGLMDEPKKRHVNKVYGRFQRPWSLKLFQTDWKTWNGDIKTIWFMDDCTRFILGFRVVDSSSADVVIELLEEVIENYGKPDQVLTDHGTEFYSVRGGEGRSKLDRFCKSHGIKHIMGRVRHPQTQGKMERTHRSASEEVLTFGSLDTLEEARSAFLKWIEYYNWDRPHQALDYSTPGAMFYSMMGVELNSIAAF